MLKEAAQGLCADQLPLRHGMCCTPDVCRRAGLRSVVREDARLLGECGRQGATQPAGRPLLKSMYALLITAVLCLQTNHAQQALSAPAQATHAEHLHAGEMMHTSERTILLRQHAANGAGAPLRQRPPRQVMPHQGGSQC